MACTDYHMQNSTPRPDALFLWRI